MEADTHKKKPIQELLASKKKEKPDQEFFKTFSERFLNVWRTAVPKTAKRKSRLLSVWFSSFFILKTFFGRFLTFVVSFVDFLSLRLSYVFFKVFRESGRKTANVN